MEVNHTHSIVIHVYLLDLGPVFLAKPKLGEFTWAPGPLGTARLQLALLEQRTVLRVALEQRWIPRDDDRTLP